MHSKHYILLLSASHFIYRRPAQTRQSSARRRWRWRFHIWGRTVNCFSSRLRVEANIDIREQGGMNSCYIWRKNDESIQSSTSCCCDIETLRQALMFPKIFVLGPDLKVMRPHQCSSSSTQLKNSVGSNSAGCIRRMRNQKSASPTLYLTTSLQFPRERRFYSELNHHAAE